MLRGSTSMKPVHAARCFLILLGLAVGDAAQAQGVSKQATTTARFYSSELRSDTVEIKLAAPGGRDRRDELEWKVRMKAGDTLVYSWTVQLPADQFYFDFHGESDPTPKVKAVSYRKGMGNADNGSMVAPFEHWGEVVGNETVVNLDVFTPKRADYAAEWPGGLSTCPATDPGRERLRVRQSLTMPRLSRSSAASSRLKSTTGSMSITTGAAMRKCSMFRTACLPLAIRP